MFINGFQNLVQPTDTFSLVEAFSLSGTFENIENGERLMTSDGFGSFVVNFGTGSAYNPNQVVISNYLAIPEASAAGLAIGSLLAGLFLRGRLRCSINQGC